MSKKLYAAFVPLFAVAAFAVMPAVAQAQPHWYSCQSGHKEFKNALCTEASSAGPFGWVRIAENKPVTVTSEGSPTLTLHALAKEITCGVKDKGTITNPTGGGAGINSITEFENKECVAAPTAICAAGEVLTVVASRGGNPLSATNEWPSTLLAGPPIRDEIREIEIKIECNGVVEDVFTGTLTPKVGSSVLEFETGSGELVDPAGNKGTVSGKDDTKGPAGDVGITAKNP